MKRFIFISILLLCLSSLFIGCNNNHQLYDPLKVQAVERYYDNTLEIPRWRYKITFEKFLGVGESFMITDTNYKVGDTLK